MRAGKKRSFSFFEVIIVSVIIGLIFGGVSVGKELIQTSTTRNAVAQLRHFDSASNIFFDKYQSIPGDYPKAEESGLSKGNCLRNIAGSLGVGCNGNGNNIIEDHNSANKDFSGEIRNFWFHLSTARVIHETLDGITNGLGEGFPASSIGKGGVHIYAANNHKSHNYQLGAKSHAKPAMKFEEVLTVKETSSIDTKIDDGLPLSGLVHARGGQWADEAPSQGPKESANCITNDNSLNHYNLTGQGKCGIKIKAGI